MTWRTLTFPNLKFVNSIVEFTKPIYFEYFSRIWGLIYRLCFLYSFVLFDKFARVLLLFFSGNIFKLRYDFLFKRKYKLVLFFIFFLLFIILFFYSFIFLSIILFFSFFINKYFLKNTYLAYLLGILWYFFLDFAAYLLSYTFEIIKKMVLILFIYLLIYFILRIGIIHLFFDWTISVYIGYYQNLFLKFMLFYQWFFKEYYMLNLTLDLNLAIIYKEFSLGLKSSAINDWNYYSKYQFIKDFYTSIIDGCKFYAKKFKNYIVNYWIKYYYNRFYNKEISVEDKLMDHKHSFLYDVYLRYTRMLAYVINIFYNFIKCAIIWYVYTSLDHFSISWLNNANQKYYRLFYSWLLDIAETNYLICLWFFRRVCYYKIPIYLFKYVGLDYYIICYPYVFYINKLLLIKPYLYEVLKYQALYVFICLLDDLAYFFNFINAIFYLVLLDHYHTWFKSNAFDILYDFMFVMDKYFLFSWIYFSNIIRFNIGLEAGNALGPYAFPTRLERPFYVYIYEYLKTVDAYTKALDEAKEKKIEVPQELLRKVREPEFYDIIRRIHIDSVQTNYFYSRIHKSLIIGNIYKHYFFRHLRSHLRYANFFHYIYSLNAFVGFQVQHRLWYLLLYYLIYFYYYKNIYEVKFARESYSNQEGLWQNLKKNISKGGTLMNTYFFREEQIYFLSKCWGSIKTPEKFTEKIDLGWDMLVNFLENKRERKKHNILFLFYNKILNRNVKLKSLYLKKTLNMKVRFLINRLKNIKLYYMRGYKSSSNVLINKVSYLVEKDLYINYYIYYYWKNFIHFDRSKVLFFYREAKGGYAPSRKKFRHLYELDYYLYFFLNIMGVHMPESASLFYSFQSYTKYFYAPKRYIKFTMDLYGKLFTYYNCIDEFFFSGNAPMWLLHKNEYIPVLEVLKSTNDLYYIEENRALSDYHVFFYWFAYVLYLYLYVFIFWDSNLGLIKSLRLEGYRRGFEFYKSILVNESFFLYEFCLKGFLGIFSYEPSKRFKMNASFERYLMPYVIRPQLKKYVFSRLHPSILQNQGLYDSLFIHKKNYYYNSYCCNKDFFYLHRTPVLVFLNIFIFVIKFYTIAFIFYNYMFSLKNKYIMDFLDWIDSFDYYEKFFKFRSFSKFYYKKFF